MSSKGIPFNITDHIAYAEGAVVSKTVIDKGIGNITLFSFDSGQGLSEHASPFDAVVYIIDGRAAVTIGGAEQTACCGEMIIMPAKVPHSIYARERFKMMLIMLRSGDPSGGEPKGTMAV